MARNIQIREPGNNYADVLHPETNSGMVLMANGKPLQEDRDAHLADYAQHVNENIHKLKLGIPAINDDLNQCLTDGIYHFHPGTLNAPQSAYGIIEVIVSRDITYNNQDNWIWQRAYLTGFGEKRMYVRKKINNEAWTNWFSLHEFTYNPDTVIASTMAPSSYIGDGKQYQVY